MSEADGTASAGNSLETGTGNLEGQLKPSAMRGSEARYGLGVALILLFVAVLNLAVRHGKGAPKHPSTALAVVGLAAALAVFPLLRTKNRFIVPFGTLIAGLFVNLPNGPNAVKSAHVLALVFPLAYALVLTQRQRKATLAQARSKASSRPASGSPGQRSRRQTKNEAPTGRVANRRYTPPKAKRARR